MKEITPESYFLNYVMPCAFIIRDLGEITDEELEELEEIAIKEKKISKKRLKKIFYRAFEKIEKNSTKWDINTIKEYFHKLHNIEIDKKEGYYATCGERNRELSKVRVAKIINKQDKTQTFTVEYSDKNKKRKRKVFSKLVQDAKIGDKVYIHFFFAIEKVK